MDWGPSAVPDEHSLWDLASLTKVVGMTTAVMQLSEQNKVDLDAPLQRYFPDWQGPHKELVTIRHLITHTSGLPAFRAYDQQTHDADSVARLMCRCGEYTTSDQISSDKMRRPRCTAHSATLASHSRA